jgi:translocation and assembly module TamB
VTEGGITLLGDNPSESLGLRYQALTVDIAADEKNVTAGLQLKSSDIGNAIANVVIDPTADNKTISGNVSLQQLELMTFKAFFPRLQTLRGILSADGQISGSLSKPRYFGSANIINLSIASNDLPISISDGFVRTKIDGTHANIDAGWQSGGAPVTLIGDADWQDLNRPTINLALDGERIEVRQAPIVISEISPSIKLAIDGRDIKINGRVDIPYARVTIQELPPNATQISKDVVVLVDEEMIEQDVPVKDQKEIRISTNVLVSLGKDVRLEGFGLRASLNGDIGIKQNPEGILLLEGEVHIPNGIYKAYGQNLTIQRGRLLFVGPIDQTAIDIDAARTINLVTAGLNVRGSIKSPVVTLFSSPQQTEENTLSYIVLGKSIDTQSAGNEANILTQAALALGIKGGRGIATSIAEQLGIQDFQIDTIGGGGESQVQLSGRLSPNLFLSYGVGVLTPVNTLKLRYNLTESFYVETAQSVESALDFFYTFDF